MKITFAKFNFGPTTGKGDKTVVCVVEGEDGFAMTFINKSRSDCLLDFIQELTDSEIKVENM